MNRLIETIRNIFKIEELRKRILYTVLIILVYRFGSFVVIPGVDPNQLSILQRSSEGGLLGLLNMFSGGAFGNASIFALGIMPYITASIIIQLLGMAVPYFQRLQKEGESGRKKLNQIMRYLTVIIVIIQAPGYIRNVIEQFRMGGAATAVTPFNGDAPGMFFWISSVILLVAGTLFIMWLGERITDKGVGNGISLLIMVGIIARLPYALAGEFVTRFEQAGGGLLAGKSFCFTGELVTMKRADAEQLVKKNGGSIKSSVTKDLSYLVTNDTSSGSSKNVKAAKLGIPVIDEKAFLALLG